MSSAVWLVLATLLACANAQAQAVWFNDVVGAQASAYGLHDSAGASMDGLHIRHSFSGKWGKYFGVYHTLIGNEFQVRLSVSNDLIHWTFVRTLLNNADMPYLYQMGTNEGAWLFMAHEQWMNPGSKSPSQLGFKMYYNESDFVNGKYATSYIAPLMPGITLMGTPNIYSAVMQQNNGYWSISAIIGFHFNQGRDHTNQAALRGFSDPKKAAEWEVIGSLSYDQSLANKGLTGNIGQRDFNGDTGTYISLQEGNLGPASPTNWANWRIFMYLWDAQDKSLSYPAGAGTWTALKPQTHGGSYAFGNPFFAVLPNPSGSGNVVLVTYFIFSEGAGPNEGGTVLFYHKL